MRIPNLFIVGAPKSGTTALYEYLRPHPEVFMSPTKEPYYFCSDLTKRLPLMSEAAYLSLFDGASGETAIGEASITYLFSSDAARELYEFNPDARIIIMLREPVSMMHSLHSQLLFTRVEDLADFELALAAEADRRHGHRIPPEATIDEFLAYRGFADYAPQIERYLDIFGREAVHIILFDDFKKDTPEAYRDVLRFIGVTDSFQPISFQAVNRNKMARNDWLRRCLNRPTVNRAGRVFLPFPRLRRRVGDYANKRFLEAERPRPPMKAALKRNLTSEFRPKVHALGELLGIDLVEKWYG